MSVTYLLDTETEEQTEVWCLSHAKYVVASGLDGKVRIYDPAKVDKIEPICEFETYEEGGAKLAIISLDQSPDSTTIYTNNINSVVSKWTFDGTLAKRTASCQVAGGQAWKISLGTRSGDSVLATAGQNGILHILSTSDDSFGGQILQIKTKSQFITSVRFSPDSSQIAMGSATGEITLIDAVAGTLSHSFPAHATSIRALTFSAGSSLLISGGDDERINIYDVRAQEGKRRFGGNVASLEAHSGWITSLACRDDSKILASGSADGTIKMWDLARHQYTQPLTTLSAHPRDVWSLAWKPQAEATGMQGTGTGAVQTMLVSASRQIKWWRSQGSN